MSSFLNRMLQTASISGLSTNENTMTENSGNQSDTDESEYVNVNMNMNDSPNNSNNNNINNDNESGESESLLSVVVNEFQEYPMSMIEETFIGLQLEAQLPKSKSDSDETQQRKPLDISLVIDTSGSMSGEKLKMCKLTVEFILTQLTDVDRLSLCNFGSNVTIREMLFMNKRNKMKTMKDCNKIFTEGLTNLSGGLLAGIDQLREIPEKTRSEIQAVFLLTDGHANRGDFTDIKGISRACSEAVRDMPNVRVFTFGYGSDHNPEMLSSISEYGRGMYYFVKDVNTVSTSFADCLGGLLSVAVQNITIRCEIDDTCDAIIMETNGSNKDAVMIEKGKKYSMEMGDMYSEEKKDVLIKLSLPSVVTTTTTSESYKIGQFIIEYVDISTGEMKTTMKPLMVNRTSNKSIEKLIRNENIIVPIAKCISMKAVEESKIEADKDNYGQAKEIINKAINGIKELLVVEIKNQEIKDDLEDLIDDLNKDLIRMSNRNEYQNYGKHAMNSRAMGMKAQRYQMDCDEISQVHGGLEQVDAKVFRKMAKAGGGERFRTINASVEFLSKKAGIKK